MSNEIDDDRELTLGELRWMARLERCLNDMPPGLEICVTSAGSVDVRNEGAGKRYFDRHSHEDNPPELGTIYPKTAGRIDGRDSML